MLSVGDRAPDFSLRALDGTRRTLRELTAHKPALVTIFKIGCPICQFTLPFLERMAASENVGLVAISQDDAEGTEEFRNAFGVTFPTLLDEAENGYAVSNAFGITHVPSMFLVEPGGKISLASTGFSKVEMEQIGERAGVEPFREGEKVPEWKSG